MLDMSEISALAITISGVVFTVLLAVKQTKNLTQPMVSCSSSFHADVFNLDGKCEAQNGECKNDSNYCDGTYQKGLCGGGNERKCCVTKEPPPELELGDVYWNSYSGYSLSTDASSTTYSTIDAAKDECIKLADYCQG